MYIKFRVIRWKNFLATGNDWIEIQLDKYEKTLIYGANGAGKSTLLDALTFALFGKAFRNLNKPLLVNSINGQDCVVELEFTINNVEYKIVRGIKPNIFEVYINGKMVDQNAGVYDYQDYLEKNILKFNFKTHRQIQALGNKGFTPFMQLTALDRRIIIEELLDIQIFSVMAKVTRNKMDHVRDELHDLDRNIIVTEEKIELQKQNIQRTAAVIQDKIDSNKLQIQCGNEVIADLAIEVETLEKVVADLQQTLTNRNGVQNQLDTMVRLQAQISQNKNKITKDIDFFNKSDTCPTCKQHIDDQFKAMHLTQCSMKEVELVNGLEELGKVMVQTKAQLLEIDKTLEVIAQNQTNIRINQQKIRQQEEWNQKLLEENHSLETMNINSAANDVNLQNLQAELQNSLSNRETLQRKKRLLEVAASLLKDNGIKTSIIKQYLPIINKYINQYLSFMDFNANFTLNENFEESIMARHRDKFAYESFSDGQQLRIDLALLFAWRSVAKLKSSVDTNILIMDEIVDRSLDFSGVDDVFRLISSFKDSNIFILSPKGDTLVDKFDHSIKFELKKDFSEVVV